MWIFWVFALSLFSIGLFLFSMLRIIHLTALTIMIPSAIVPIIVTAFLLFPYSIIRSRNEDNSSDTLDTDEQTRISEMWDWLLLLVAVTMFGNRNLWCASLLVPWIIWNHSVPHSVHCIENIETYFWYYTRSKRATFLFYVTGYICQYGLRSGIAVPILQHIFARIDFNGASTQLYIYKGVFS